MPEAGASNRSIFFWKDLLRVAALVIFIARLHLTDDTYLCKVDHDNPSQEQFVGGSSFKAAFEQHTNLPHPLHTSL